MDKCVGEREGVNPPGCLVQSCLCDANQKFRGQEYTLPNNSVDWQLRPSVHVGFRSGNSTT